MHFPFLVVQCDWNEALWEPKGNCWILAKNKSVKTGSIYGKIHSKFTEQKHVEIFGDNGFEVISSTRRLLKIKFHQYDATTTFVAPVNVFDKIHTKQINDMDISNGGGLGVSISTDGDLFIWDTTTGLVRRTLSGHVGEVNCCRFFPSGVVVLSGGSDTQLKIWSAADGSCPRTLNGKHQAGILSLEIVERGKNILSASRDGCLNLWDCGTSACIGQIANEKSEINCCHLMDLPKDKNFINTLNSIGGDENLKKSDVEFGTDQKMVSIACQNGNVEVIELSSRKSVFNLPLDGAVNVCHFLTSSYLVAGTQDGEIVLIDVIKQGKILLQDSSTSSAVLSIFPSQIFPSKSFWVGFYDGRCALYHIITSDEKIERFEIVYELSGPDCDPVNRVIETSNDFIFTCCRDGIIRKYKIVNLLH